MGRMTASEVIDAFGLEPLDGEGGYFRETWSARDEGDDAPIGTCILYLVTPESFSALHRLDHDEIYHFYLGDPCETVMVAPDETLQEVVLGQDIASGMRVQHIVPAGSWQGTRLAPGGSWALLGTTMAPGFHPAGFELATEGTIERLPAAVAARVRAFLAPQP